MLEQITGIIFLCGFIGIWLLIIFAVYSFDRLESKIEESEK